MVEKLINDFKAGAIAENIQCRPPIHLMHVVRRGRAEGGMENGIVNVCNRLPAERYRVSICALDTEETFSNRIRRANTNFLAVPKNGRGIDWSLVVRLARIFRQNRVDLVHSHNWGTFLYAVIAAKLTGIPIVHGEHGKNIGEVEGDSRPKRVLKVVLAQLVERIVTVSQALAEEWIQYGIRREKVQCIPNGVDSDRFHPRADRERCRKEFGLPSNVFLAGGVGRLDELKNFRVFVGALGVLAKAIPDIHIALLGDGPERPQLLRIAEELGIADRTHFLGYRSQSEVFMACLDLFVLPSKSEGMSNVVLEAMSTGLPIICADLPSHREVFEPEKEGVVLNYCEAESLAAKMAEMYRQPEMRKRLGSAARARAVSQFSIGQMVSSYDLLYSRHTLSTVNSSLGWKV